MMYYVGQFLHRLEEGDTVVLTAAKVNDDGFIEGMQGVASNGDIVDLDPLNISPYFIRNEGVHKRTMFFGNMCPKIFGAGELDLESDPGIVAAIVNEIKSLDISKLSIRKFK